MKEEQKRPEWVPNEHDDAFASKVMKGVGEPAPLKQTVRKKILTANELAEGVKESNRTILAQAITLVESNAPKHQQKAQTLIQHILPYTGNSIRIGITGVPGAGKSTFIEAFGTLLCEKGHKVAVLAVDPSSSLTGGSILGDKTRMEQLVQQPNAFIRPSPSGRTLGGVNRRTRETILLCEAAGYDVILVETVGVGQSEGMVRDMVDFFLLLSLTGAGDELQGIKRGILELTDAILINKADGDNKIRALQTVSLYEQMSHLFQPVTEGWSTYVGTCSALYKEGLHIFWDVVQEFAGQTKQSGVFQKRRNSQKKNWLYASIREQLEMRFFSHPSMKEMLPLCERDILEGTQTVTNVVERLMNHYEQGRIRGE
ncbi:methylmalonyl Co-A mutase-associated GTPase MeaB [Bacillus sp. 165]|uniref:methylmalonyl Co-A mutase-associated GTPase MeaB n=1 Tax=Bacillus sp. 165 TaxID=1529117 RepID=UPI001ADA521E|nr:methylmalonyl Co-A mutase-associated GTPase MeaB [Bacillus sp. 165]MBO9129738.1 methylmalonyl Co-A mutase-associated GTPase MeaB [Bacillus sp. 165]